MRMPGPSLCTCYYVTQRHPIAPAQDRYLIAPTSLTLTLTLTPTLSLTLAQTLTHHRIALLNVVGVKVRRRQLLVRGRGRGGLGLAERGGVGRTLTLPLPLTLAGLLPHRGEAREARAQLLASDLAVVVDVHGPAQG